MPFLVVKSYIGKSIINSVLRPKELLKERLAPGCTILKELPAAHELVLDHSTEPEASRRAERIKRSSAKRCGHPGVWVPAGLELV